MKLEERVAHLEKRCRRLAGILMGTMAVTTIVDGDGKVRIRLGKADAGYGVIVYDETGRHRATLTDAPAAL